MESKKLGSPAKGRNYSDIGDVNNGIPVYVQDYDPYKHRVKVARLKDGESPEPARTYNTPVERKKVYEQEDKRILKVGDESDDPIIENTKTYSRLSGDSDTGFFSFKESGNFIKGPISYIMKPSDIRMSALLKMNDLLITGFPSTIVTPLPVFNWSIPGASALKPMMRDVLTATTLLAAVGSL